MPVGVVVLKLSYECVSVGILELSCAVAFVQQKLAYIQCQVTFVLAKIRSMSPSSRYQIPMELPFEYTTVCINLNSLALHEPISKLPFIV